MTTMPVAQAQHLFVARCYNHCEDKYAFSSATLDKIDSAIKLHFSYSLTEAANQKVIDWPPILRSSHAEQNDFSIHVHRESENISSEELTQQIKSVKEITIDFDIPLCAEIEPSDKKWMGLAIAIHHFCSNYFPAQQTVALNIHRGCCDTLNVKIRDLFSAVRSHGPSS